MLQRLSTMLGFGSKLERPKPDKISASVVIAVQQNERAGERARNMLDEMLHRNDIVGHKR